jgi:hypothetical protein
VRTNFAGLIQIKAVCLPRHKLICSLFWSALMMDAVMVALGLIFFAGSVAYVYACDRL